MFFFGMSKLAMPIAMSNKTNLTAPPLTLKCGRFSFLLDQPLVMGIVNTTPDSFSDGGQFDSAKAAIEHAFALYEQGATILDIGGESTRPGAPQVDIEQEWARVEPVLKALTNRSFAVSIDTRKPEIMRRALALGVDMINDVEGFANPLSIEQASQSNCGCCIMHMQGTPLTMQQAPDYRDLFNEVTHFFYDRVDQLRAGGVASNRLCIDPGIGFGKTLEHNLLLIRQLKALEMKLQLPVLVGLSRKSFIGQITGRSVDERLAGSVVAAVLAVQAGAKIVRVHDVGATVDALKVAQAIADVNSD
jgi:dihydropteroate synthase